MVAPLILLASAVLAAPPVCTGPPWFREGDQTDCRLGTVAPAGDVNGDGFADVLIGSYRYSLPEQYEGVIFVYLGSPGRALVRTRLHAAGGSGGSAVRRQAVHRG